MADRIDYCRQLAQNRITCRFKVYHSSGRGAGTLWAMYLSQQAYGPKVTLWLHASYSSLPPLVGMNRRESDERQIGESAFLASEESSTSLHTTLQLHSLGVAGTSVFMISSASAPVMPTCMPLCAARSETSSSLPSRTSSGVSTPRTTAATSPRRLGALVFVSEVIPHQHRQNSTKPKHSMRQSRNLRSTLVHETSGLLSKRSPNVAETLHVCHYGALIGTWFIQPYLMFSNPHMR